MLKAQLVTAAASAIMAWNQLQDWPPVRDLTRECQYIGNPAKLMPYYPEFIVIHRHGETSDDPKWTTPIRNAIEMGLLHANHPVLCNLTGRCPYHFVIHKDGTVDQAVPLAYSTPHARRYSQRSISIAVLGDFRTEGMPVLEQQALVRVSAVLMQNYRVPLVGHMALEGYGAPSKDHKKECPGKHLHVEDVKFAANDLIIAGNVPTLEEVGIRMEY